MSGTQRLRSNDHKAARGAKVRTRLTIGALFVSALTLSLAAPAFAGSRTGVTGSPQPELAQWKMAAVGGEASGVVLPDGNLVVAYLSSNRESAYVCLMSPGERACAHLATLDAYHGGGDQDSFYGTPEILATGGKDVTVALYDCCYIPSPASGGAVVFNSTNDGETFGSETAAGTVPGVSAAALSGGQVVVADTEAGSLSVQAFPAKPTSVESTVADIYNGDTYDTSMTSYKGGILIAWDNLTDTVVSYAPSGSDFNDPSAWHHVVVLTKQTVVGISGDALVTDDGGSLTGGDIQLRFFNGSTFGSPFRVPEPTNGDDGYFSVDQAGGRTTVFFENRRNGYDLYVDVTGDGSAWSDSVYGSAIDSSQLVGVLGSIGSGICLEADAAGVMNAQPLLNPQSVRISLVKTSVNKGTSTILNGAASPVLKGQQVTLQYLSGGKWYNTGAPTTESSAGKFAFTVPGETDTYRVTVNYELGYYQYGYSNSVALTAIS
jgi:hypothetical protein